MGDQSVQILKSPSSIVALYSRYTRALTFENFCRDVPSRVSTMLLLSASKRGELMRGGGGGWGWGGDWKRFRV